MFPGELTAHFKNLTPLERRWVGGGACQGPCGGRVASPKQHWLLNLALAGAFNRF